MMFQYLVSGLATGAKIILYEGSPLKDPSSLWNLIDEVGITIFGTSAKYLEQISKTHSNVKGHHDLSSLRQILSTGSPLPPVLFDFVYDNIKKDVLLGSVTGKFDLSSTYILISYYRWIRYLFSICRSKYLSTSIQRRNSIQNVRFRFRYNDR